MAVAYTTLEDLLERGLGIPSEVVQKLKDHPFGCTTVTRFANFFETRSEIKTLFCDKVEPIIADGGVISELKQAWREAEAMTAQALHKTATAMPDAGLEDPLSQQLQESILAR